MKTRTYRSPLRDANTGKTRDKLLASAMVLLQAPEGFANFSLEAVARAADVTRATVYKHFGSRRALLETVFDQMSVQGGLPRLEQVMEEQNPHLALSRLITVFCDFWGADRAVLAQLHSAAAIDQDFKDSLQQRNERRRRLIAILVDRMAKAEELSSILRDDLVDTLFALTSVQMFEHLSTGGRSASSVCELIQRLSDDAVKRAGL